jgi:mono/diheme cytochrome c family protein
MHEQKSPRFSRRQSIADSYPAHTFCGVGENDDGMRIKPVLLTVAATLAALLATGALVAVAVIYGGLYNIAATEQHFQPVFNAMEITMRHSVRLRARHVEQPPLTDEAMILRGGACFRDKCAQCHGAPGVAPDDMGKSLQPLPGPLVNARRQWRPRELYWITRHGVRMSGMPAWQHRLTDAELWSVVAFMQRLPDLSAAQYTAFMRQAPAAPSCGVELPAQTAHSTGNAVRGQRALAQYACNSCHTIPGVTGAAVHVGPPLAGLARRARIAGTLANTPDNLVLWLRETQRVKPMTAMPQLGVGEQDARDIAAYLGTLH